LSCISIFIGITIFIFGVSWISILEKLKISGAKDGASLTLNNEKTWKDIPGFFDINIHHDNYFFSVTNEDDVIYKGVKPIFEEYGPFIYREH